MNVKVNSITGFEEAFAAMYMSKRTWTPELDEEIRHVCHDATNRKEKIICSCPENFEKFNKWMDLLLKIGRNHITLLRFIDISIMTGGIHRAGQDDIDSHARRFDNRIIRSSTRIADFSENEMSDFYKNKIIPTDTALREIFNTELPDEVTFKEEKWVKTANGYVKAKYKYDKDVKRGLYMLSIPSNFISKINLCEWAHVFKERNKYGGANPEVKEWAESVMEQITEMHSQITRDYVLSIKN